MELSEYLNNIEMKLQSSFDIERDFIVDNYKYDMFAEHHLKTEKYILTRKTVIDVMESNELCFLKYFTNIDEHKLQEYIDLLVESIDSMIDLENGHMSSIITGVVILDNKPDSNIIEIIKKFKCHKGFAFGFKGWVDIRLILVAMNQRYIAVNKKGKEVLEVYSI